MCDKDDNTKWPATIEDFYIELIYEESKTGIQTSTLDRKTSMKIANELAIKFGKHFIADQLKAKWNRLRRSTREFKALIETTGFGWDSETNTVTAEKEVWDSYVAVSFDVLNILCYMMKLNWCLVCTLVFTLLFFIMSETS